MRVVVFLTFKFRKLKLGPSIGRTLVRSTVSICSSCKVLEIQIHKLQGFYIMFTENVINFTLGVVRRHFS